MSVIQALRNIKNGSKDELAKILPIDDEEFLQSLCDCAKNGVSVRKRCKQWGILPEHLNAWANAKPERLKRFSEAEEDFERNFPRAFNDGAASASFFFTMVAIIPGVILSYFHSGSDLVIGLFLGFGASQLGYYMSRISR